jgi:methionyl aminopeptidase
MTIAIEPMLTMDGSIDVILSDDKWTYETKTGALATHFEHTVLVTDTGYEILTQLK